MLLEYIILHNIVLVYNNIVEVRSENIATESIYFPGFFNFEVFNVKFFEKKSLKKFSLFSNFLFDGPSFIAGYGLRYDPIFAHN